MRERFCGLPEPLQKQAAVRIAGGALFLFLFAAILIGFRDFYFSFPCLLFSGFLLISGLKLCYNSLAGDYMCVQGVCEGIETAGIRKRVRGILVRLEGSTLRVPVRQGMKRLSVGDGSRSWFTSSCQMTGAGSGPMSARRSVPTRMRGSCRTCRRQGRICSMP